MDVMWSLGARYCVRQDAHAFMWLLGLFLALAGTALALRRSGARFLTGVLLFFAFCTGALGISIMYGCYNWAPYSMGLGASISATELDTFMCLSKDAFDNATTWTIIVLSCAVAVGLVTWARSPSRNAGVRVGCYIGALLSLLVAAAAGFLVFFGFSWCLSDRLF